MLPNQMAKLPTTAKTIESNFKDLQKSFKGMLLNTKEEIIAIILIFSSSYKWIGRDKWKTLKCGREFGFIWNGRETQCIHLDEGFCIISIHPDWRPGPHLLNFGTKIKRTERK